MPNMGITKCSQKYDVMGLTIAIITTGTRTRTERVQNGFRTDTERLSNGNGTDTERLRITKIEESVLKNANYKRTRSSEHTLRLRYQSAYRGFGNDVTLNTSSSNFYPAQQS